jgi:hypothetical protein
VLILSGVYSSEYRRKNMFRLSDFFILLAVAVSFAISGFLWFNGYQTEGLFTAIWVPSILAFGIYFKLAALSARSEQR